MREQAIKEISERLCGIESALQTLAKQHAHINKRLDKIIAKENVIMADLTDITAKVQATTDAEQSAILLLNSLAEQLRAAATDPAAIAALASQLDSNASALAAAVIANTPAAP